MTSGYYSQRKWLLLSFDVSARLAQRAGMKHYGKTFMGKVIQQARQEYAALIPQIPYIGGVRNPLTFILISSAMFLALYKAMQARSKTVDETGILVYEMVEWFYNLPPRALLRWYGRISFNERSLQQLIAEAAESQKRQYPGNWVFDAMRGDGLAFDRGADYTECGICKFFQAQDALEFAPYMCRLDTIISDRLGWGLVRTTTLAEGGEKCDFRYTLQKQEG